MGKVIRPFCWHQNFVPKGLSTPAPGLYTCGITLKNLYKIRVERDFLKLATNDESDKAFLLASNFWPQGVVCPCAGAIYMWKNIKKCVWNQEFKEMFLKLTLNGQSDKGFLLTSKFCLHCLESIYMWKNVKKYIYNQSWKRFFFKLATNVQSDKAFLLASKFWPQCVVCPLPGAIYMWKNMKKTCIKSDFKEIVLKLATNGQSDKGFLLTSTFVPKGPLVLWLKFMIL